MKHSEILYLIKKLAFEGKDFNTIHEIILKLDISSELKDIAERNIDHFIVQYQLAKQEKSKALNQIIIGFILIMIGSIVFIITYYSTSKQFVLMYGAILAGIGISWKGFKNYLQPIDKSVPKKNKFRKHRFFNQ